MADYKLIEPIYTGQGSMADAVVENDEGTWLAEWDEEIQQAMPLRDDGGDYLPAPENWQELVEH
jgi:hypothetical protein